MSDPHRVVYREFGAAFERPPETELNLTPAQQDLRITVTRAGRKGKTVTVISGFRGPLPQAQALLKELKNLCGAGGSLDQLGDRPLLEIQGDHRAKVLTYLLEQGYRAKPSGG
ncbi:MAG: stress response translation initiation inhibitor YciH [Oscillatoriales cyanobacterium SM2_2_1]|nr:stress response translation initiation inhibitor YciH [Oscillatoriales cyanobacterium SM2_2_1]